MFVRIAHFACRVFALSRGAAAPVFSTLSLHDALPIWEGIRLMLLAAQPDHAAGPGPDRVAFVEALRKVPAEQRRALVLYHLADLTVEQIAAETGVRPGTVKARLARARAALTPHARETIAPVHE